MKEIRALVAVLTVFFVVVVAAAVVVLFVPPPVVAAPIGDCGSKSWIFFFYQKGYPVLLSAEAGTGFPCRAVQGHPPPAKVYNCGPQKWDFRHSEAKQACYNV